ncbi:positive regulator for repZ translation [Salmonella enterica]|uniref:Positive regulator for repZ translation n=1 Tax=Salmonella oranienberg TaxID=28147 RepID=A0A5H6RAY1_SALON|nr:positive regulator for repZ translation [Salmonella enterica]EBD5948033.1 positive regulator for repZ translation [Salmonella enterica subsp. enterica serovar Roodepoort]EBK1568325.1 positive regulator for repZ translation [Salmonella enterica subsp. enterica serovar Montevideo]EBP3756020.1 positive regulator for repZ translation [Salmonella enterica subsp. enterica]EBQ8957503.1 positive regulator for repZ translation [Salmonella enterica subsp. enterica serovar Oranienburg]EDR1018276.1 pos
MRPFLNINPVQCVNARHNRPAISDSLWQV